MSAATGTAPAGAPARSLLDRPALYGLLAAAGLVGWSDPAAILAVARDLRLPDTDDAMRLAQVRDLLGGQGWFDLVQHRFLPPSGVESHWSRLLDAPLAGLVAGLAALVGRPLADGLAAALWPPLLFFVFAAILYRGVGRLFTPRAGALAVLAATQTLALAGSFAPGRIDHHNVQVCALLGLGLCLMAPRRGLAHGLAAGALAGFSAAVGLEAAPLIAAAGLVVAVDWVRAGRAALRPLLGFALGLAGTATILFAVQTGPARWGANACDALSPPWLWLAWTGAAAAGAAALAERGADAPFRRRLDGPAGRLALLALPAAAGSAGFVARFPACLDGPFPGMPDLVRVHWLQAVREMQPLGALVLDRPEVAAGLAGPLFAAALVAAILAVVPGRSDAPARPFAVAALFLGIGAVQTLLQLRGHYVATAFVPLVAGPVLDRALSALRGGGLARPAGIGLAAAALALNAQAWLLPFALARLAGHGPPQTAPQAAPQASCTDPGALAALGRLPAGTVLAPIDLGPHLLVHTPHSIVAAPYHRAVPGLVAGIEAFGGDEADLRRHATATGATYVAACPGTPAPARRGATPFAERLARGTAVASWLEPVPLPGDGLRAWRMR